MACNISSSLVYIYAYPYFQVINFYSHLPHLTQKIHPDSVSCRDVCRRSVIKVGQTLQVVAQMAVMRSLICICKIFIKKFLHNQWCYQYSRTQGLHN